MKSASDSEPEESVQPSRLPLFMRTRAMGLRGLHASSIGWVLAGCILLGFGVGTFLDRQFGTTYWMPLLVLVGIAAGFREMFIILAEVNRAQKSADLQRGTTNRSHNRPASTLKTATSSEENDNGETVSAKPTTSRLFAVPEPPLPSYLKGSGANRAAREKEAGANADLDNLDELDSEEIIERLSQGVSEDDRPEEYQNPIDAK